jgi:hypothetical protein
MSESLEPQPGEPVMGFEPGKLRDVKVGELAIRFGFGAGVSTVAAVIGVAFGPTAGGLFLAFPAILPATLTLLEQKHGTDAAVHDDRGAVLGSLGLVAFAVTATVLFTEVSTPVVLAAAAGAWAATAIGVYLAVAAWQHGHSVPSDQHRGPVRREQAPGPMLPSGTEL